MKLGGPVYHHHVQLLYTFAPCKLSKRGTLKGIRPAGRCQTWRPDLSGNLTARISGEEAVKELLSLKLEAGQPSTEICIYHIQRS